MSDKISQQLLNRAHSPDTASQIYGEKIAHRPLLLRPTSPPPKTNDARAVRQRQRADKAASLRKSKKPRPLSAKEKRALCVYEIPKLQQKHEIYVPLNRMWVSYMQDILGLGKQRGNGTRIMGITAQSVGQQLVSADFHGADIEVVRSRCVSRVGAKGIVVKDTKFTFEIVTKRNELKSTWYLSKVKEDHLLKCMLVLPKEHTIFRFEIPLPLPDPLSHPEQAHVQPLLFELHGSQFETPAPGRALKKFKMHIDSGL